MKVFILAAGFGKRLRPFTEKLPKPLIKIKHKPLIDWNLKKIKKAGFKNIVINTHYLSDKKKKRLCFIQIFPPQVLQSPNVLDHDVRSRHRL